jgi:hypothetical protein
MKKTITTFTQDQATALRAAFHDVLFGDFTTREHKEADKWFDAILHTASMHLIQAVTFDHVISNFTTKAKTKKAVVAKKTTVKTKKHARK